MTQTFNAIWTALDSTDKVELSKCLNSSQNYLSQIAHGREPSPSLARNIALVISDKDGRLTRKINRVVIELFPNISIPSCPSLSVSGHHSKPNTPIKR